MAEHFTIQQEATLLPYLFEHLKGWSKKRVKQRLQGGYVTLNGTITTQHNARLNAGDTLEVGDESGRVAPTLPQQRQHLEILYQDRDLIAINKPHGLLSVGTTQERQHHALARLRTQLSRKDRAIKLWPVHRLDRETSGVLLFATSKAMREAVMAEWHRASKVYFAVVEGTPKPPHGTIDQPLYQDEQSYHIHVGNHPNAKEAITHYQVERSTATRALLRVTLETGRQHQIRVHLAWLGHSVISDERYGTKSSVRLGLHAHRLTFIHPKSQKEITVSVPLPASLTQLLKY